MSRKIRSEKPVQLELNTQKQLTVRKNLMIQLPKYRQHYFRSRPQPKSMYGSLLRSQRVRQA